MQHTLTSSLQAHIDNTAKDGRRLTVLTYLNPKWHRNFGGALGLHAPPQPQLRQRFIQVC